MRELDCKEIVELMTDYIEGKLSEGERLRFEDHLSTCKGCTAYLEQMRQTIRLTGQLREENLTLQEKDDLLRLFRDWKKA